MRERVSNARDFKGATDKYNKVLRVACRVLDIKDKKTLHSLRHTYACIRRLQTNGNMPLIRDELRHRNITTTQRYCEIPIKRLEDELLNILKTG